MHKAYQAQGKLDVRMFTGQWLDTGTFDSLLEAGNMVAKYRGVKK